MEVPVMSDDKIIDTEHSLEVEGVELVSAPIYPG
jgi:hypothetical protein